LEANSEISGLTVTTIASNGKSGDVQINGSGNLAIDQLKILTAQQVEVCLFPPCSESNPPEIVNLGNRGQAGDVRVDGLGNLTFSNSLIQSDTRSNNSAGSITITSPGVVSFTNSQIISNTSGSGKAGDITLDAPVVNLMAQSQLRAETTESSRGSGGRITITAPTAVSLTRTADGNPVVSVRTNGAGKAGDITINTSQLTLSDAAEITATATQSATNRQGGGSITLNASQLNLAGKVGVFAETQGQAPAGTLSLNSYNNQPDLNIALTRSSQISASTSGSGKGGDLIVYAPQAITIAGPGKLAVETSSTGNAGNMTFTTRQLTLKDGVEVSASTSGAGKAGDVGIKAETLTVSGGAKVSTNTASSGQAGNLTVNVKDQVTLTGNGTGLFASTTPGSTGNGGNIIIDPRLVRIEDGATIAVNSEGTGTGGNIFLQAGRLELRNRGSITAETASAQGGNLTLKVSDVVLLRRNSLISATAGTAQAGGNGGNVTINTPFVIGFLPEDSDIRANAFSGTGGNITINANQIFGLRPQPQNTPFSDITASSQLGISGTIILNTLTIDPSRGLQDLNLTPVDPSKLVAQGCNSGRKVVAGQSKFVVLGRGGLSNSPDDPFGGTAVLNDLGSTTPSSSTAIQPTPHARVPTPIIEAQSWIKGADGKLYLVNSASLAAVAGTPSPPLPCQGL
jgi:large exoprotein involved in heme utilization and adhesion